MARSFFVTIDGPKGVGKSTLFRNLHALLSPRVALACHVEKDIDPQRDVVSQVLRAAGAALTPDEEHSLATLMAQGRAWITETVIVPAQADVLLFDRWYPSDAAFRRYIPFIECLSLNQAAGAAMPDLVLAAQCRSAESWRRAHCRAKGFDSLVIHDFKDHCRSTDRFRATAAQQGWTEVQMEAPAAEIADHVAALIVERMTISQSHT
ncbi:MAG: hypothetical protein WD049_02515 [Candidatus Paceibacterota bacterium]